MTWQSSKTSKSHTVGPTHHSPHPGPPAAAHCPRAVFLIIFTSIATPLFFSPNIYHHCHSPPINTRTHTLLPPRASHSLLFSPRDEQSGGAAAAAGDRAARSAMDAPVITLLVFLVAVAAATAAAEMPRMEHPRKGDGSLSLLAVGDWGRRGAYNQSMVAAQVID